MAHRIIAADNVALKPAAPVGTQGYATNAAPGTVIPAEWHNSVQDELCNVIALKGGLPNPANDTQLAEVLGPSVLAVEGGSVFQGAPVVATNGNARAVISCETGSAGAVSSGVAHCLAAAGVDISAAGSRSAIVASLKTRVLGTTSFAAAVDASSGVSPIVRTDVIGAGAVNAALIACQRDNFLMVDGSFAFGAGGKDIELDADGAVAVGVRDAVVGAAYSGAFGSQSVIAGPDASTSSCAFLACQGMNYVDRVTIGTALVPASACAAVAVADVLNKSIISGTAAAVVASGDVVVNNATRSAAVACGGLVVNNATRSAAVACGGGTVNGTENIVAASNGCVVNGLNNAAIASRSTEVDSTARSGALGSESCLITDTNVWMISAEECFAVSGETDVVVLSSRFVSTALSGATSPFQVMGGVNAGPGSGPPTWRINSQNGAYFGNGTYASSGADYAEYFENLDGVAHAPGRFVARWNGGVTLGQPGMRAVGPVSVAATVTGNDDSLGWQGQYLRDEWGALVQEEHRLEDGRRLLLGKRNPDFDPSRAKEHRPRSERPAEWTRVALVGQVIVAVEADVAANDFLCCGVDGKGRKAAVDTRFEVMEIVEAFDAAKGYGRAKVLVR
jgi:hypothetical protein